MERQLRPHPDVVDTEVDEGETVLLHLSTKTYYSLNRTGARIWQGVKHGLSVAQIGQSLQAEFAVEADHAERSVRTLLDDLVQQGLVQVHE
jgi:hypothetical protein